MQAELRIRPARAEEGEGLSALALRAKSRWGYAEEFVEASRQALAINAETIAAARTFVRERAGETIGFYGLVGKPPRGVLEWMFLEPEAIGRGLGRRMWDDAIARARTEGFGELRIESDRFAEPFYLAMGAVRIGSTHSPVDGAPLPLLKIELS